MFCVCAKKSKQATVSEGVELERERERETSQKSNNAKTFVHVTPTRK